jgi:hypothetical protein
MNVMPGDRRQNANRPTRVVTTIARPDSQARVDSFRMAVVIGEIVAFGILFLSARF